MPPQAAFEFIPSSWNEFILSLSKDPAPAARDFIFFLNTIKVFNGRTTKIKAGYGSAKTITCFFCASSRVRSNPSGDRLSPLCKRPLKFL